MNHDDHVALLRDGVPAEGGVWADLGSGAGAFALALADLLGPRAAIYSVDQDARALAEQARQFRSRFPATTVRHIEADFTRPLDLPQLDGIVIANALHFVPDRNKPGALRLFHDALRPGGRLVLVEYNSDRGNPWVPFPLSWSTWAALSRETGFSDTRLLATRPSRFLGEIYSALSFRPAP